MGNRWEFGNTLNMIPKILDGSVLISKCFMSLIQSSKNFMELSAPPFEVGFNSKNGVHISERSQNA